MEESRGKPMAGKASALAALAAMLMLITLSASNHAQTRPQPRSPARQSRSLGPLFPAQDLGLLEAPDREQWQKSEQIMDELNIADGATVAEIGAAGGWFTIRLARRVGPNGIVYAEDIQRVMVDGLVGRVQRENLTWVRPILGTPTDPRLPPGIDAILLVDVYHEMDDPVTLLRNAAVSLKPFGMMGIVDFLPGGGGPGPAPDERPEQDAVIRTAQSAGLQLMKRAVIQPFMFLLVFEQPVGEHR